MAPSRHPDAQPTVVIDPAPAYELLMSLATHSQVSDMDTYEIGSEWLGAAAERAGDELLGRLRSFANESSDLWIHLAALAYETPAPRDVATFVAHLRETDADEIRLHMVGYYSRETRRMTPPEVIRAAVGGDRSAIEEFLRTSYPEWEPWQAFLRRHLETGSAETKMQLLEIVEAWAASVWAPEASAIMAVLERDADEKRALLKDLPFERFIETATNGVEWVGRPGIRRVVMVPTYVYRPWVSNTELGDTQILIYPVSDESVSAETDAPPLRLVRLSKALADEKRLRILRTLAEGDRTLMELAELFGVPKTTMHHHMITLRSAGLVSVGAGTKNYRLRHETLPDVGALLSGYLGAATGPSAASGPASQPPADRPARASRAGRDRRSRLAARGHR